MITIIGAGMGGLTTALALHQRGIECQLFESAQEIQPLGVGINLLPHACKEVTELGLLDVLRQSGIETQELHYYNRHGQQVWRENRGLAAGYEWPQISIHRGELQMLLLDAVLERLGPDALRTGMAAESVAYDASGAEVTFTTAEGRTERVSSRGVIAADGIHSSIRRQFYPDEGMPIWNGSVLWRGLIETEPFLGGRSMFMAGHESQKFVAYPVSQSHYLDGRSQTNWIAELRYDTTALKDREDWNRRGDFGEFAPQFESWQFDWLNVPELIEQAPICYEFPMVDRDPVATWSFDGVTLLGDAAHPMYPIGSNGASQAILDARCIADQLQAHESDIARAFKAYEAIRLPLTAAIVKANRGNGPEQVMQLAEERAPDGFADLEAVIPLTERQAIADRYKQIAGFAKNSLNA